MAGEAPSEPEIGPDRSHSHQWLTVGAHLIEPSPDGPKGGLGESGKSAAAFEYDLGHKVPVHGQVLSEGLPGVAHPHEQAVALGVEVKGGIHPSAVIAMGALAG
jgi:hypothetical protein